MEYLAEKIGMSRTLGVVSTAVTLLKVREAKILTVPCECGRALAAYQSGKRFNKAIAGNQKKYALTKEFNRFARIEAIGAAVGDQSYEALKEGAIVKTTFNTKGRGFSGLIKRWNFQGGPAAHGSRFHRTSGSIGNRDEPGRVHKGRKMSGHYGNEKVTIKSEVLSFDADSKVLVVKGSVPGPNGALGRIKVVK
ncbi:MAG: 50S ribosomal protein L3 [Helicobacteraceae bacterium]|jgi:large subunit ribosomal protein L3|nr:50S ribosomal protein L3 [Helicobacteraceae bacterium]